MESLLRMEFKVIQPRIARMGSGFAGEFYYRFYSCLFANSWFKCAALAKSGEPRRTSAFQGKGKSRPSQTAATKFALALDLRSTFFRHRCI
jgi:hypothetical protein